MMRTTKFVVVTRENGRVGKPEHLQNVFAGGFTRMQYGGYIHNHDSVMEKGLR